MCKKKMATSSEILCRLAPQPFRAFTEAVVNLKFDEEPRYSAYIQLFESLCGPSNMRPILMDPLPPSRVGQKRGRDVTADDNLDLGAPKKKTRLGLPATQWITVSPFCPAVQLSLAIIAWCLAAFFINVRAVMQGAYIREYSWDGDAGSGLCGTLPFREYRRDVLVNASAACSAGLQGAVVAPCKVMEFWNCRADCLRKALASACTDR